MSRTPLLEPKRVRRSQDPVTGEMVTVILDAPQLAYERAVAAIDGEALKLHGTDYGRFMDKLAGRLATMFPHTDSDVNRDCWAALVMVLARRLGICSELLSRCAERKGTA